MLSTAFFALLSFGLILKQSVGTPYDHCTDAQAPTAIGHQVWKRSDLSGARDVIELEDVQFNGNSAFDDHGRFFLANPSPINYTGAGPEVDAAWDNITLEGQRDFLISEKEARELWPNDYKVHWNNNKNGYVVGLDLFHALHCLDNLRKSFYPEFYPVKASRKASLRLHQGHCINQLRQHVMCAGDMTPYGMKWYPNPGRYYADSDVTHTCRNFKQLQDWTANRYHAGGNVHIPGVEIWSLFEEGL
jgi:hypothetical protein